MNAKKAWSHSLNCICTFTAPSLKSAIKEKNMLPCKESGRNLLRGIHECHSMNNQDFFVFSSHSWEMDCLKVTFNFPNFLFFQFFYGFVVGEWRSTPFYKLLSIAKKDETWWKDTEEVKGTRNIDDPVTWLKERRKKLLKRREGVND